MNGLSSVTCIAPINIALIKYWGKSNEEYNIPLNSSLSVTLHPDDLCTMSTMYVSDVFKDDEMWLNGKKQDIEKNIRLQRCLNAARSKQNKDENSNKSSSNEEYQKCRIVSVNNFPTAAGLASSASGYACLAKCLGSIYSPSLDLSVLARLGSGSACRSVYDGFVKWEKGTCPHGSDSKAVQIAPSTHWPDLKVLILVVSNKQKSVGSTEAMRRSVNSSELLQYRAKECVPRRMVEMEKAIVKRDFETFAMLTMKESNQLHCICQDTYPPITPPYMNGISHQIVHLVTKYNQYGTKAAYTFDAGPNAVLFTEEKNFNELLGTLMRYFYSELLYYINLPLEQLAGIVRKGVDIDGMDEFVGRGGLEKIIITKPGPGAHVSLDASPLLCPTWNCE